MACSAMSSGAEYVEPDGFRIEKVRDIDSSDMTISHLMSVFKPVTVHLHC